ncbi:MAG: formyltransferase family protein [Bacteroidia bacterium]|nr:formyltransferase family protein [Bacteroidia bacterium]
MSVCAIAYSGRGRLAAAVAHYLQKRGVSVIGIVDRPSASVAALSSMGLEVFHIQNQAVEWLEVCETHQVRLIALAGFLALVPSEVVRQYTGRILNSHPALLPAFGGPGMYGSHVHKAVAAAGAQESGFTIHYVTERYDEGPMIYQVRLPVGGLSAHDIEAFVQATEREVYPAIVYRIWCAEAEVPAKSETER